MFPKDTLSDKISTIPYMNIANGSPGKLKKKKKISLSKC